MGQHIRRTSLLAFVLLASACGKSGYRSQPAMAGLTGGTNEEGRAFTAAGDPEDLAKAQESISPEAASAELAQGIRWISIDQKSQNDKPMMEMVVRYRDPSTGKVLPVKFQGEVISNGGQGARAELRPVAIPATTTSLEPSPNTSLIPQTDGAATLDPDSTTYPQTQPVLPGIQSVEVQCSGNDCAKADVSFMDSNHAKVGAAIVRTQVSEAEVKMVGSGAPTIGATDPNKSDGPQRVPFLTRSIEVANGRSAIQLTEQNTKNPLRISGDLVETNEGVTKLKDNRDDIEAHLRGNSNGEGYVLELVSVPVKPKTLPTAPAPKAATVAGAVQAPKADTRAKQTQPGPQAPAAKSQSAPPAIRSTTPPKPTTLPAIPAATVPAPPPKAAATNGSKSGSAAAVNTKPAPVPQNPPSAEPRSASGTLYLTFGGTETAAQGHPQFDFCPNAPKGIDPAAKAIREACANTFWTNRPEFNRTLKEVKEATAAGKSLQLGAKDFFTLPGSVRDFQSFLQLFTKTSPDPRQNQFLSLIGLLTKATLSVAWTFVPYVESRFITVDPPKSPAGAAGTFQFMASTAAGLGLASHERNDFTKASDAAVRFMGQLLKQQDGDFLLALSSYNLGAGATNNAEAKADAQLAKPDQNGKYLKEGFNQYTSDWWKILFFNMASKETQHYVIRIVTGLIYGMNPEKHGIQAQPISLDNW